MSYTVKEIFHTIQGEGANIGRASVFIRFCDTDFVGGTKWGAVALAMEAHGIWPGNDHRFVVLTGGEPLLQVDATLVQALRGTGFTIAIETNGTQFIPSGIDWVCVSPKAGAPLVVDAANELKLVYPQQGLDPADLAFFPAATRWLSPMAGPDLARNTAEAAAYCLAHPEWRLAIQAHKFWGGAMMCYASRTGTRRNLDAMRAAGCPRE